jgi:hypothetical protein
MIPRRLRRGDSLFILKRSFGNIPGLGCSDAAVVPSPLYAQISHSIPRQCKLSLSGKWLLAKFEVSNERE